MNAVWDIVFSPMGLVLYAGFWALKLTVGVWVIARIVARLPLRQRLWTEQRLVRMRLMKRPTDPLG
ncbi:hypothetical protein [Sagittula sp. SSi028]|uniref:hypothetical protein n=1 Tax=Sagittula sp. SSi028 TaxID=3400636 RepID=UPI003AF7525D